MSSGSAVHPEVAGGGGAAVLGVVIAVLAVVAAVVIAWRGWYRPGRRLAAVDPSEGGGSGEAPITASVLLVGGLLLWLTAPLVGGVVLSLGAGRLAGGEGGPALWAVSAAQVVGYMGGLGGLALLVMLLPRLGRVVGLGRWRGGALGGLAGFAVTAPIVTVIGWAALTGAVWVRRALGAPAPNRVAHERLRELVEQPDALNVVMVGLAVVVGAPVFEEVVYRGFVQSGLLRLVGSPWAAILATSAIFTMAHVGAADGESLVILFALSVMLGVAFERTGSLATPIVMHAAFNAMNVAMVLA